MLRRSEAVRTKPDFAIVYGEPLRPPVVGFGGVEIEPLWVPKGIAITWEGLAPEGEVREAIQAALRCVPESAVVVSDDAQKGRVLVALLAMARGEDPIRATREAGCPLTGKEARALGLREFEYETAPFVVEEVKGAIGEVADTCAYTGASAESVGVPVRTPLASLAGGVVAEVSYANPLLKEWDYSPVNDESGVCIYGVGGDYEIVDRKQYYLHILPDGDVIETASVEPFLKRWLQQEANLLRLLDELGIRPEDWQGGYEIYGVNVEPDGYYIDGQKVTDKEAADYAVMAWYADEYGRSDDE